MNKISDNNVCPKCGGAWKWLSHNGVQLRECTNCAFQQNALTGETLNEKTFDKSILVLCPRCSGKLRVELLPGAKTDCPYCRNEFTIPEYGDPEIIVNVTCPHCSVPNQIYANQGEILFNCGACGKPVTYYSGEKYVQPATKQPAIPAPAFEPAPQPPLKAPDEIEHDAVVDSVLLKMVCAQQAQILGDDEMCGYFKEASVKFIDIIVESTQVLHIYYDMYGNEVFRSENGTNYAELYQRSATSDYWGPKITEESQQIHYVNFDYTKAAMACTVVNYVSTVTKKFIPDQTKTNRLILLQL